MTDDIKKEAAPHAGAEDGERIAKVLARAGLCSRREAEEWIVAGRVAVDGKVLATPAFTVTGKNRITVDGKVLPVKERTRLWLFHKPRGLVTTTHDPEGRPTVFSVLPEDMPRVVTIGRLDINTEGLLLLTNDGGLARVLELPATGWLRRYRVRAYGEIDERDLKELEHGVSLDGIDYGPIEASIERVQGHNVWLVLGLREGKNREVKRVLASLGLTVNRLIRVSFGPFQLADLEEGEIREIKGRVLRDQLGKRLVAESGADFEAPIVHHIPGAEDEEEAPKRRIKNFTPSDDNGRAPRRPERTKMEFIGTGEKRAGRDGDDRGGRAPSRDDRGGRGERPAGRDDRGGKPPYRSEGFRGRTDGDRPQRSEGFRGRPDGDRAPRSEGFRPRTDAERPPRSEGFKPRADGDRPQRSGGFKPRPEGDRPPRGEGFKPRSEGFRGRPDGDRPRSGGFRDRPEGDRPRPEGFRGRPDGDRPQRSSGFKPRPDGDRPRPGGFRDRPDGDRPHPTGFKPRTEGGDERPARPKVDTAGFGPRGPRGMNPGDRNRPARASAPEGGAGGRFGKGGGAKPGGFKGGRPGGGKPGGAGGRGPGGPGGKPRGPRGDRP